MAALGKIVTQTASREMARCALFSVKASRATLWESHGFRTSPPGFKVTAEPLFTLPHGEPVFKGPVPGQPEYAGFFERLGVARPREILVAPVYAKDRLAAYKAPHSIEIVDAIPRSEATKVNRRRLIEARGG